MNFETSADQFDPTMDSEVQSSGKLIVAVIILDAIDPKFSTATISLPLSRTSKSIVA